MYRVAPEQRLVLASASPRRREMLRRLGLEFALAPSHTDESLLPGEEASAAAQRLARLKAQAAAPGWPGAEILAADTLVAIDDRILGKPADEAQAHTMLELLNGAEHQVLTGFCLKGPSGEDIGLARTRLRFRSLATDEIQAYVYSGEPLGKAGAYAIQGQGAALVESVRGSYTNVVGLPLAALVALMLERGVIRPAGRN